MLETTTAYLSDLARNIRLADVFDVALVALFLYVLIGWLRRFASRGMLATITTFVLVYFLARAFEMYLTEMVIESLAAVMLIAAVVVFQSDIRRLIESVTTWGFASARHAASASAVIDTLVQTAQKLADDRTGALIAIRGREAWDRHIEGGCDLYGRPSEPLLLSIFSPHTPGHDGALLIEGERITRFGVHLPLSSNLGEIGGGGTRHAAALGLSEHCDAMVIVISEERGTISVAEGGRLARLGSSGELKSRLEAFWREHYAPHTAQRVRWWRRPRLQTAALSVTLAVVFWLLVAQRTETVYRTFVAPIELRNPPQRLGIDQPAATEARITLAGSEQAFRLLEPARLAVSFDLSGLGPGENELDITQDNLRMAGNLRLYQVEPRTIRITAHRLRPVELPIEVQTTGALPNALRLRADPQKITLLLPEDANPTPRSVLTEPVDLRQVSGPTELTARLIVPNGARLPQDLSSRITVRITESETQPAPQP